MQQLEFRYVRAFELTPEIDKRAEEIKELEMGIQNNSLSWFRTWSFKALFSAGAAIKTYKLMGGEFPLIKESMEPSCIDVLTASVLIGALTYGVWGINACWIRSYEASKMEEKLSYKKLELNRMIGEENSIYKNLYLGFEDNSKLRFGAQE